MGNLRLKIGIMTVRGVDANFRTRLKIVRNLDNPEVQTFVNQSVHAYKALTGVQISLDDESAEFDWSEFFEFLKWLIPLLIEFLGPIIGI